MAPHTAHTYPAAQTSPAEARSFVLDTLQAWGREDLAQTACLLTSELVTNAVLHAGHELQIRLCLDRQTLRVEVEDADPCLPVQRSDPGLTENGRGLRIVEYLSQGWGTRQVAGGKVVWFDLGEATS